MLYYSLPLFGVPRELAEGRGRAQHLCAGSPHLYPLLRYLYCPSCLPLGLPYVMEGRGGSSTFVLGPPTCTPSSVTAATSCVVTQAHRLPLPFVLLYHPRLFHVRAHATTLGASLFLFRSLCAIACFSFSLLFCQC